MAAYCDVRGADAHPNIVGRLPAQAMGGSQDPMGADDRAATKVGDAAISLQRHVPRYVGYVHAMTADDASKRMLGGAQLTGSTYLSRRRRMEKTWELIQ